VSRTCKKFRQSTDTLYLASVVCCVQSKLKTVHAVRSNEVPATEGNQLKQMRRVQST